MVLYYTARDHVHRGDEMEVAYSHIRCGRERGCVFFFFVVVARETRSRSPLPGERRRDPGGWGWGWGGRGRVRRRIGIVVPNGGRPWRSESESLLPNLLVRVWGGGGEDLVTL